VPADKPIGWPGGSVAGAAVVVLTTEDAGPLPVALVAMTSKS